MKLTLTVSAMAVGIVLALFAFLPYAHAGECAGIWLKASFYGSESGNRTADGAVPAG